MGPETPVLVSAQTELSHRLKLADVCPSTHQVLIWAWTLESWIPYADGKAGPISFVAEILLLGPHLLDQQHPRRGDDLTQRRAQVGMSELVSGRRNIECGLPGGRDWKGASVVTHDASSSASSDPKPPKATFPLCAMVSLSRRDRP